MLVTRKYRMRWAALLVAVAVCGLTSSAQAQFAIAPLPVEPTGTSAIPLSASEGFQQLRFVGIRDMWAGTPDMDGPTSSDSIARVFSETGARWLALVRAHEVKGLQLDAAGTLGVIAGQEAYAKAAIAERLATPGLSFQDRAYTYMSAVQAFGGWANKVPERLPIAEGYLKQLDALGDSAVVQQFIARQRLIPIYSVLGRSADVIRLGERAIELVTIMPFMDRNVCFLLSGGMDPYFMTVQSLSGATDGVARIAKLTNMLRTAATPTPEMLALDPMFATEGMMWQGKVNAGTAATSLLGTKGAPVTSNRWLNMPSADSQSMAMDDGKIRVMIMGTHTCSACFLAWFGMQKLQKKMSGFMPMLVTHTEGSWGNRLLEPAEESDSLANYFLNNAKLTFPIALSKLPKKTDPSDGGFVIGEDPNVKNYPEVGKPMIWVLDGAGFIRYVSTNGWGDGIADKIEQTVIFLQREAASGKSAGATAIPPAR